MAYIKERGNNTYLVRISLGLDEFGKGIQKSKTFHPSSPNLSKAKIKKELDLVINNILLHSAQRFLIQCSHRVPFLSVLNFPFNLDEQIIHHFSFFVNLLVSR